MGGRQEAPCPPPCAHPQPSPPHTQSPWVPTTWPHPHTHQACPITAPGFFFGFPSAPHQRAPLATPSSFTLLSTLASYHLFPCPGHCFHWWTLLCCLWKYGQAAQPDQIPIINYCWLLWPVLHLTVTSEAPSHPHGASFPESLTCALCTVLTTPEPASILSIPGPTKASLARTQFSSPKATLPCCAGSDAQTSTGPQFFSLTPALKSSECLSGQSFPLDS